MTLKGLVETMSTPDKILYEEVNYMANVAADAGNNGITRREFLYYIWGASIALVAAQSAGLLVWFLIPKFREGEFGGIFTLSIEDVPEVNAPPAGYAEGRFWLSNLDTDQPNELMTPADQDTLPIKGVAAIYKVCTHLGCIYTWVDTTNQFECPCHGSKYRLDGRRIELPAPRDLDRFKLTALADDKTTVLGESALSEDNGTYLPLELHSETAYVQIDTGAKKLGSDTTLLCDYAGNCP